MRKWLFVALLVVGASVLGATVLREPIALAAQAVDAKIIGPLDGEGNVRVHEQGTVAVKLDRDGNVVRIASSSSAPVDVDEVDTPRIEPWQREGEIGFVSLAIPAGRLGVIEYVSGRCFGGSATNDDPVMAGIRVTTTEDGHEVAHFVPSAYRHLDRISDASGATGELVRIYAGGGTTVEALAAGSPPCEIHLSGHLEG